MANLQVGVAGNGTVTVGAGASVHSPASNTLTLGTNGDERVRIDSSGRILVGHTATTSKDRQIQLVGTTADGSAYMALRHSADANCSRLDLCKSRNATIGSNTILQVNDEIGAVEFLGDDGTDIQSVAAKIVALVDGTPGTNDMPGRLSFWTTADGANSSTERLRITSSGDIVTQGLTDTSFDNDGNATKVLEVTGDGTASEYGVLNLSGNQNSSATVGAIKFINRENSNTSSGSNANSRNLASIDVLADTSDSNAGDDSGGFMRFITKADGGSNAERLRITAAGNLKVPDSAKIELGGSQSSSGDLQIYHSSSDNNSYIVEGGSGSLMIQGDVVNIGNVGSTKYYIRAYEDGKVDLRYAQSTKLETTSGGVEIKDDLTLDGTIYGGHTIKTNFDGGGHMYFRNNSQGANYSSHFQTYASSDESGTLQTHIHYYHGGYAELLHQGDSVIRTLADGVQFRDGGAAKGQFTDEGLCFGTDTATANALDDYEEGTWTPVLKNGSNTITHTTGDASTHFKYTKIGRLVHLMFCLNNETTAGTTGGSSNFNITGAPFAPAAERLISTQVIWYNTGLRINQTPIFMHLHTSGNFDAYRMISATGGYTSSNCEVEQVGSNSYMFWQLTYETNS